VKLAPVPLGVVTVILSLILSLSAQEKSSNPASQGAPVPSAGAATINGSMTDFAGTGLAGAVVTVESATGVTRTATIDAQGAYSIPELPSGPCNLSVVINGAKAFQAGLVLSAGQVMTLGLAGIHGGQSGAPPDAKAAITGTVSDAMGTAVAGAVVSVVSDAGFSQNSTTDPEGIYAAADLSAGTFTISVTAHDTRISQLKVSLTPGQVLTLGVAGPLLAQAASLVPASPAPAPPTTSSPINAIANAPAALPARPPGIGAAVGGQSTSTFPKGNGAIAGSVVDQTGAVVVGALVKVSAPGGEASAVTDDKGSYAIKGLPPGTYKITVTAPGFKPYELANLSLPAGEQLPLDAQLEPAGERTQVNVEGEKVAQVETETAEVAGTITQKEVVALGLNGRNFSQLIALTPGVSNQTGQDEAKVGVTGSVKYSVNGGRVEYNTFEVDGSDVLNAGLNGAESTLVVYPSLDAIQEVKVLTSNYGAMYGRTASGTVIVSTKSGGSQWHGNAYEFLRNEAFNARNYFDQTKSAPLYRRNDFGFTLGGPVSIPNVYNTQKDKTFVFWSEEFRIEKSPSDLHPNFNHAVPSALERQGDFSDVCPIGQALFSRAQWPDCPSAGVSSGDITKQLTFPNNNIGKPNPFGTLDPNALAILGANLIPLPNSTGGCNSSIGSCYDAVISEPTYWREELFRLDHQITAKLRASFRYIHDAWDTTVPVPQWGFVVNSFPTVQNRFIGPGTSLVARLTHTITPSLLNDFTASYASSHITLNNVNGPGGADYQRPSGLGSPGGSCTPIPAGVPVFSCPMGALFTNGFGGKIPGIVIGGNNQAYGGNGFAIDPSYMPWEHTNPVYSIRDDLSKALGKHTLQLGVQVVYAQRNETNGAIGAATGDVQGLLTFSNINGGAGNTGNAFANFLTLLNSNAGSDIIQSYTQDSAQFRYYNRYWIYEPFVQDDWKVNSRLTLNLGVRFSLFGLWNEKYRRVENWDPAAYSGALASQVAVNPTTGQLLGVPGMNPIPINLNNPDSRLTNGLVQCGTNSIPPGCMKGHFFNPAPRVGMAWEPKGDGKTSVRAGYGIFFEHGTGEEANTGSLQASPPYELSMTQRFPISYGCIGGSAGAAGFCPSQPGAYPLNVTAIPTQAVWPYAQQWSLSVQRELSKSTVGTIAYVGSKGTHLTVERQLNQLKPAPAGANPFGPNEPLIPGPTTARTAGDCGGYLPPGDPGVGFHLMNGAVVPPSNPSYFNLLAACTGENGLNNSTPDVNTLRPYPGLGQIFSLENVADSDYHALQATLRRTQGALTVGLSYSYSHSLDDSSDRSDATFVNSYDLLSNRASSNFDQRHLFNFSYVYALPLGRFFRWLNNWTFADEGDAAETVPNDMPSSNHSSWLQRALVDGWEISGITVFQSGTPFSVINGGSSTISVLDNAGVANGVGAGSYPDVMRDSRLIPSTPPGNPRSFGPLLANPNMFVAPRGLTFGDAGRNFLNNPGRLNWDISLLKRFPIREAAAFEFRAEAFNVFNHTQFRIYNPNLGNTGSNVISCYGGPNFSAGFSSATSTDCLTGSSFLHPVDAHRPRTLQLAIKFSF
jgi:Carboxypeptidase regulatory-like domain/TonB-dependent Receptor Plug Domain